MSFNLLPRAKRPTSLATALIIACVAFYSNVLRAQTNLFNSGDITETWSTVGISEFMAINQSTVKDQDGDFSPWIELFNGTAADVNLNGWALTDDTNNLMQWRFPNVTLLDADDANGSDNFLVVFASGKDRTNNTAELHTNFRLPLDGGYLALVDPHSNIVSVFEAYPAQQTDVSYGRDVIDPTAIGYMQNPTPGNPNSTAGAFAAPPVTFSQAGSTFTTPFTLQVSSTDGATIYYTTDGSFPTTNSTPYPEDGILISTSTQIRARAFVDGLMPGAIHGETYLQLDPSLATTNSDLPAVIIYNFGKGGVPASIDQLANISIYEPQNGVTSLTNGETLNGRASIHLHGSSTLTSPKQSFAIDFWDESDIDTNYSPFGFPPESDFILYGPDFYEPVLMHNPLIYGLSNEIGRYASRTRFVEVYLNTTGGPVTAANYNGIYVFEEKIKWDKNRVDVDKIHSVDNLSPQDNSNPNVTGGYIAKVDRVDAGETGFDADGQIDAYDYPKEVEIKTPQRAPQMQYFQNYMDSFSNALNGVNYTDPVNGYRPFIDMPSWIDWHIMNAVAFNVDMDVLSTYYDKRRDDVLYFGPIWDFDRAEGSKNNFDYNPTVWGIMPTDIFRHNWWARLFTDIDFWQAWIDRYQNLREGVFSTNNIFSNIDALAAQVAQEDPREIARWPTLTVPRNGTVTANGYTHVFNGTYQGEVDFLKQWYSDRLHFIDTNFLAKPIFSNTSGVTATNGTLVLTASPGATIYYTTDNTDPRLSGGTVSSSAFIYDSPISLGTNITIFARAFDPNHFNLTNSNNPIISSSWSGVTSESFVQGTAPTITQNPTDLQAYVGQNPTFTIQTGGSPTPSFQWQLDGENLADQTNSQFTLTITNANQTGTYSVIVSNALGNTNLSFVLTVTPKPNLVITEVMSSEAKAAKDSPISTDDWWELSNFGNFAVNLQGYRFDDDHDLFSDAQTITNAVTIAPGESVVLVEDMSPQDFRTWWGPQNLPANLQIITYPSIGFSSDGDAIYLWNAAANSVTDTVANVTFPAATKGVSFGYNFSTNTFGALSIPGQNGAFIAPVDNDIGSPGTVLNMPSFTSLGFDSINGGFALTFVTEPNLHYTVESKNDLSDAEWTILTNFLAGSNSAVFIDNTADSSSATRFYRVVVSP